MKPVIQEELTGCGIAASAALAGVSYAEAKQKANALGIYAADTALWSKTEHVRTLLREFGISASSEETPFKSWESLPDKALMAIKWRIERGAYSGERERPYRLNVNTIFLNASPTGVFTPGVHVQSIS